MIEYEHSIYKPGYRVEVSESIREVYSDSPVAGKVVRVCKALIGLERPRDTFVPVECPEVGCVLLVEQKYVSFVDMGVCPMLEKSGTCLL